MDDSKTLIGRNVRVDIVGYAKQVPAKVDTGADSSSIWASNIEILQDGTLHFTLFDVGSPFYDGKVIKTKHYAVTMVRSAMGHEQIRYRTILTVLVKGKRIRADFSLSNRSRNSFPVLIGRRTLHKKFIVDVENADDKSKPKVETSKTLTLELREDPYAFYQKYHGKDA